VSPGLEVLVITSLRCDAMSPLFYEGRYTLLTQILLARKLSDSDCQRPRL
jgi:hypothetical protein